MKFIDAKDVQYATTDTSCDPSDETDVDRRLRLPLTAVPQADTDQHGDLVD